MSVSHAGADTLIILARDQASLYDFLKPRQEASGRTIVILDRRTAERRQDGHAHPAEERRKRDRRAPEPEAALALMSVLGFMILHKDGERWMP